jgi:hypothetical protein
MGYRLRQADRDAVALAAMNRPSGWYPRYGYGRFSGMIGTKKWIQVMMAFGMSARIVYKWSLPSTSPL